MARPSANSRPTRRGARPPPADRGAELQPDAAGGVQRGEPVADVGAENVGQQRPRPADQDDVAVHLAQARSDFAADEAVPDDGDRAGAGRQRALQGRRVGQGPDDDDPRVAVRRAGHPPGFDAGGDDQAVVAELLAVDVDDLPVRRQRRDRGVEVPLGVDFERVGEQGLGPADRAGQQALGQRGTVVGDVGLGAEDDDFAVEPELAQPFGGTQAGEAGSGDDDAFAHRVAPNRWMALMGQARAAARTFGVSPAPGRFSYSSCPSWPSWKTPGASDWQTP